MLKQNGAAQIVRQEAVILLMHDSFDCSIEGVKFHVANRITLNK